MADRLSTRYSDFPRVHLPFYAGDRIQMIRKPSIKATIITASSMRASVTGAWYKILVGEVEEFISGHEWRRTI